MFKIHLEKSFAAPPEKLWAVVTDHEGMPKWMDVKSVRLIDEGRPERNGLGARRETSSPPFTMVERVSVFQAPSRMEYILEAGFPVRDHLGVIQVQAEGSGSRLTWAVQAEPLLWGTGWILRFLVNRTIRGGLEGLSRLVGG